VRKSVRDANRLLLLAPLGALAWLSIYPRTAGPTAIAGRVNGPRGFRSRRDAILALNSGAKGEAIMLPRPQFAASVQLAAMDSRRGIVNLLLTFAVDGAIEHSECHDPQPACKRR
jgi:hypothetical protein